VKENIKYLLFVFIQMNLEELKKRFCSYDKKDIIITEHAELQAFVRKIELDDVKENIINPKISSCPGTYSYYN